MACLGILSIDGNVGAGKTTIFNILKEMLKEVNGIQLVYVDEPVDRWTQELELHPLIAQRCPQIPTQEGTDVKKIAAPLKIMYEEGIAGTNTEITTLFQFFALVTRVQALTQKMDEAKAKGKAFYIIGERLIVADLKIFTSLLLKEEKMKPFGGQIFFETWRQLNLPFFGLLQSILMVNCPADVCLERVRLRGREGEKNTSLDYLEKLEEMHQKMRTIPVTDVDWSNPKITNEMICDVISKVQKIIAKNQ